MKKQRLVKILGTLSLCFFLIGSVGVATASAKVTATENNAVSISENKLYIGETEVTATSANFKTWKKASVYLNSNSSETDYTGIRFLSWISDDVYNSLVNSSEYTVTFGTMVANKSTVDNASDFTKEYLTNTEDNKQYLDVEVKNVVAEANEKSGQTNVTEFSAVVYGIKESNYATQRMARAYMTVTSIADENSSVTIYANYEKKESRCIADVAMAALQANAYESETVDSNETNFKKLSAFAKKGDLWQEKYSEYDYVRYISTFDELKTYATDDILKAGGSTGAKVCLVMKKDIDLSSATWTYRTADSDYANSVILSLSQSLDGNGYKLFGLTNTATYYNEKSCNAGFIGKIESGAVVKNLIFSGSTGYKTDGTTVTSFRARVGVFAYENAGTIENCYIQGKMYSPWKEAASNLFGAIFINNGTIQNTVTEIIVKSAIYEAENNFRKFGFAVCNYGEIKNCVTVSTVTDAKTSGGNDMIAYDWMSATGGTSRNSYSISSYHDGEFKDGYGANRKMYADTNRTDSYIFTSYENLISGNGYGFKGENEFSDVTSATAQEKLGSAWTFDAETKTIKLLLDTVIYSISD